MEQRPYQIIIESRKDWRFIDLKEIIEYRDLFYFLIWRSIRVRYAQSMIGIGWAVIQPFFSMIVFTIVFGRLANIDSEGVPYALFSFAALVPWTYFSNAVTEGTNSLVAEANMVSKVYFPRILLPLSAVCAKSVDFCISLVLLFILMLFYQVAPTWGVLVLPLLILIMILSATGMGTWLTALAIQYRDVKYAITFLVQLLMYAAPVVYPTSLIPEHLRWIYALNPMVGVIEGFRSALLGTTAMPWGYIILGFIVSLLLAVTGAFYFRFKEKIFADVA